MSLGPLGGIPASAAGSPLAQTVGSEVERAQQDTAARERRVQTDQKADNAAGIGQADGEDHETAERDADGRRVWERLAGKRPDDQTAAPHSAASPQSKDASGQSGNLFDLTG